MDGKEKLRESLESALTRERMSLRQLATAAKVSHATLSNIRNSKGAPSPETLNKLAPWFRESEDTLHEWGGHKTASTSAPPLVRTTEDILRELQASNPVAVPVLQNAIAHMGEGSPVNEYVYLPPQYRRKRRNQIVAVVAVGDCMEPDIRAGDYVIFEKDVAWKVGDIVVAAVDGEVVVRRLIQNGTGYVLRADATKETVTLASDDLIMGRVLQITRPLF